MDQAKSSASADPPCKNRVEQNAGMAELADAYGSGPYESNFMQVQVLLPAPNGTNPNLVPIGEGFGFVLLFGYPNFNLNACDTDILCCTFPKRFIP